MTFTWQATSSAEVVVDRDHARRLHRMGEQVDPNPFWPIPGYPGCGGKPVRNYDAATAEYDHHGKCVRIKRIDQ